MRVLLIEDDTATAQSIELMLKSEGFNVYTTDLGEEGIDLGKLYDYDIILLDLNLPDMPGFDVLKTLRLAKINTPIFILSGTSDIETKVRGLGTGADDYMTKPFHKDELVARIHAVVRRSKGHSQSIIRTGEIGVQKAAGTASDSEAILSIAVKIKKPPKENEAWDGQLETRAERLFELLRLSGNQAAEVSLFSDKLREN